MASLQSLQSAIDDSWTGNPRRRFASLASYVRLRQQEEGYLLDPLSVAANRPGKDPGSLRMGDRALRGFASQYRFDLGALRQAAETPDQVATARRSSWRLRGGANQRNAFVVEYESRPYPVTSVLARDAGERTWLARAMIELREIDAFIETEGLPPIGENARSEVSRILQELSPQPVAAVVYPAEGEIVIQFTAPKAPEMITIDVNNDGQGACFAHIRNTNRRKMYLSSSSIPDDFVRAQLRELSLAE